MEQSRASLLNLPDELLLQILYHVPPETTIAVRLTSPKFKSVTETTLLWRHYCHTEYQYWDPKQEIQQKFLAPAAEVRWESIFARRRELDIMTSETLDSLLSCQQRRYDKMQEIVDAGYDAKDELLRQCNCSDDAEDVLARRYWSQATLNTIHRTMAIEEWEKLQKGQDVPLERALGAFDMFVLDTREGDFDNISRHIDDLAEQVRAENPDLESRTTRQKALDVARFLRAHDLTGVASDEAYTALRNSFIGIGLNDPAHQALPLISTALYCCVARRLGLDAKPCGFPFHVYGIVYASSGHDLDGRAIRDDDQQTLMYVDPFRSDLEVPLRDLTAQLSQMRVSPSKHPELLRAASTREMVLRTGRNIMNSVQQIHQRAAIQPADTAARSLAWVSTFPDMDDAFYGTLWAMLLLGVQPGEDESAAAAMVTRRRTYLPYIFEHFQNHFPWDARLIAEHIVPTFRGLPELERIENILAVHSEANRNPKLVLHRSPVLDIKVKYKVGQMFRHRRYRYEGIVCGWDARCEAGDLWIQQMGVDSLQDGRDQSFYHVMVDDRSMRYVAQENIAPIDTDPSEALLRLAGKHFKRWDAEKRRFVSNIKDEYPDD
ncbi:hypothetical protein H2201_003464 [Coniosporium apollinis]|uniref:F-box domain-containing protein n=1 Tax=Coniosporium apollinis TaxID=61459 RepID=A0ABQ9NVY6_9PEZI|nr:hypothetical protein H2201_003464 [Coniosporium apollinis]